MNRSRIEIFILLLGLTCYLASCSTRPSIADPQSNNAGLNVERRVDDAPLHKLVAPKEEIPLPNVSDFCVVVVWRKSSQKNESGGMARPFNEAEIGISLTHEPQVGDRVTLIPLGVNLDPFQVSIIRAEKKEETCTGKKYKEYYWDTDIERLTNREILYIDPTEN